MTLYVENKETVIEHSKLAGLTVGNDHSQYATTTSLTGYVTTAQLTTTSGDIMTNFSAKSGYFDDGINYRVIITKGVITAISGTTASGFVFA
jgi:hypothetical protein